MKKRGKCSLRIARQHFEIIKSHLFPGDHDEHGAVLLAGASYTEGQLTLHVREVHLAQECVDYVQGKIGYRALAPQFIHRLITRARDERLVYLAVHNHGSDREVGFSSVDYDSHGRGYPALLQIARGMPVGALVFGLRSLQADIWLPGGARLDLERAVIVGNTIQRLSPSPKKEVAVVEEIHQRQFSFWEEIGQSFLKKCPAIIQRILPLRKREVAVAADTYDRQIRMFGKAGQAILAECRVGIIGLGGVGSILAEYLARLGVGEFCLVDDDHVEESNLSRIVGATASDARNAVPKVAVAKRLILQANDRAKIKIVASDVARESAAKKLISCEPLAKVLRRQ